MTDSELYELLRNGIEPEDIEPVSQEEIDKWLQVLEETLNDNVKRCPCQNRKVVDRKLNGGD